MKTNHSNRPLMIYSLIAGVIILMVFFLYGGRINSNLEEKKETKRLDGILAEINDLYIANEELTNQWEELEKQQQQIHGSAEMNRKQIDELWNEYYKNNDTDGIMQKICDKSPKSPMCNNYKMLEDLKKAANERNVDYTLLLGIMFAESHIGNSWSPKQSCSQSNNWAGLKWRKYDDGTISEKYTEQYVNLGGQLKDDLSGCYLYYFEDIISFFESLANTIGSGYAKCNNDPYCIMKSYVGHDSSAWLNNVYSFYQKS